MIPTGNVSASRFPVRFLTVTAMLSVIVLVRLGWNAYRSYQAVDRAHQHAFKIEQLRGTIIHLDEVLTMSARMAAATGDRYWEDRYRQYDPQLDAALQEALVLSPEPAARVAIHQTDAANSILVEMENRAFALARQGRLKDAQAVLSSDSYDTHKQLYSQGIQALANIFRNTTEAELQTEQRKAILCLVAAVVAISALFVAWLLVLRIMRRWQADLLENDRELRASDRRLRGITSALGEGVYVMDVEGRVTFANPEAERLLGWSEAELLGQTIHDTIHNRRPDGSALAADDCPIVHVRSSGKTFRGDNQFFVRKNGTVFPAEVVVAPLLEDNHVLASTVVFSDITHRKQAEEELRKAYDGLETHVKQRTAELARANAELLHAKDVAECANRAKSEFLANMSHEIRTPMTAILGFGQLLKSPTLPEEDRRQFLESIQRNGNSLLELINGILDLSRIEADKLVVENSDCRLWEVVDDVLSAVKVQAEQKRLQLEVDYRFPLPDAVLTDALRLHQILLNLVSNAVKFTERGVVRIVVHCVQEPSERVRLQFVISDTGIGIPAERLGELFQPFMQIDGSSTRRFGGTGLGLAISKRLAKFLGGDIEVTSQLGKGSTFTLTIDGGSLNGPMMLQSPKPEVVKTISPSQPAALRGRVLLADDVSDVQMVISQILRQMNLQVDIAGDGRAACETAEKAMLDGKPYDLILMDIQMPKMDGFEAARWLRTRGWRNPIVALTAHAMVGDREKCLNEGFDDYISKPVDISRLHEILARYLAPSAGMSESSTDDLVMRSPDVTAALMTDSSPCDSLAESWR